MKYLYILLFVLPLIGFGQGWEGFYGGEENDQSICVQQTIDGGYVVCGMSSSFSQYFRPYIVKVNQNGEEEWSGIYGGFNGGGFHHIEQTIDGGYIVGGNNSNGSNILRYLVKINENGDEEWSETYSNGYIYDVQQTIDGGYIIGGGSSIIKTDQNGVIEWEFFTSSMSIDQTIDGGYINVGSPQPFFPTELRNVYLTKLNEIGEEEWNVGYVDSDGDSFPNEVHQTSDNGFVISYYSDGMNGIVCSNSYILKTNEIGEEEWTQNIGSGCNFDVLQNIDGGYTIFRDPYNLDLTTMDENGNELWVQVVYETVFTDDGVISYDSKSFKQTNDDGYILCGDRISSIFGENSDRQIFLLKTDSEGNVTNTSTIELPTLTSKRELIKTTNLLGQENTTIKNQPLIEIYDDGSTEKKIVIE